MRILGIDPGTAIIGWAIVDKTSNHLKLIECGAITTPKTLTDESRLLLINKELQKIIIAFAPQEAAVEQLYFANNAKTVISVAQARGVVLFTCAKNSLSISSYSPLAVKKTITGDGKADKKQVQYMLRNIIHLNNLPKLDDITDAIAIAYTHAYTQRYT